MAQALIKISLGITRAVDLRLEFLIEYPAAFPDNIEQKGGPRK